MQSNFMPFTRLNKLDIHIHETMEHFPRQLLIAMHHIDEFSAIGFF